MSFVFYRGWAEVEGAKAGKRDREMREQSAKIRKLTKEREWQEDMGARNEPKEMTLDEWEKQRKRLAKFDAEKFLLEVSK